MRKLKIDVLIPILSVVIITFVIGFITPDIASSKGNLDSMITSVRLLPQRLESLGSMQPKDISQPPPLPIIETYSKVIDKINNDYYGTKVNDRDLTYSAIRGMLFALGDPFTRFMEPSSYKEMREENEGNFTGIGAQLDVNKNNEVYIKEPLPQSPAIKAGVKANDVIIAVNGKIIKGMVIDSVVKLIRGPEGTKVKLVLRRPGFTKLVNITIVRQIVEFQMIKSDMLDVKNGIGYIRLYQFNEKADIQLDNALASLEKQHLKGLVFDLRGNPGGLLTIAVDIGSRFIRSGPVVIIQERGGRRNNIYVEEEKHDHKAVPVVVLVDKSSASASEIVSGAIKDTKSGTLVGTTTFGKGRVQTIIPMADGSAVAITTSKYLTPNGIDIHKKGIEPDYWVELNDTYDPTIRSTDNQLMEAVKILKVKLGLLPVAELEKLPKTKPDKKV